jgi:dihydroneopterin aldolase
MNSPRLSHPSGFSLTPTFQVNVQHFITLSKVGVLAHEHLAPQRLAWSVTVTCTEAGWIEDSITESSFNYAVLVESLQQLEQHPHTQLLETLCQELAQQWFGFPTVQAIALKVEKLDLLPPPATIGLERHFIRSRTN